MMTIVYGKEHAIRGILEKKARDSIKADDSSRVIFRRVEWLFRLKYSRKSIEDSNKKVDPKMMEDS
jgi:hypothetical protein